MRIMTDGDVKAAERFIDTVGQMRTAQKNFFRYRGAMMMLHAKKLERAVDEQLAVWEREREGTKPEQQELFLGEYTLRSNA